MTVLGRAEKGIKEEGENVWNRERKTTAGKVMKHMLKNERSLTERKKKNQWRGVRQSNTYWEGREGDWMVSGWGLTAELWSTAPAGEAETIAGAGLWDNKGKRRADWKVALGHLPPVEKRNQIQSPSCINWIEGQLIKKNTHMHTHTLPSHTVSKDPNFVWEFMSGWQKRETAYSCDSTCPLSLENDPDSYIGHVCHPCSWVLQKNIITEL